MYDFSKQKAMLEATFLLLEENNLSDVSTLSGWNDPYKVDTI